MHKIIGWIFGMKRIVFLSFCTTVIIFQNCYAEEEVLITGNIIEIYGGKGYGNAVAIMEYVNQKGVKNVGLIVMDPFTDENDKIHWELLSQAYLSSRSLVISVYGKEGPKDDQYDVVIEEVLSIDIKNKGEKKQAIGK